MFEIDVNVWRFVAIYRHKTLKQYIDFFGIQFGDAEAIADHRIGCRSASLTQNAHLAGLENNVVYRQEIRFVFLFGNQGKFFLDQIRNLFWDLTVVSAISA